MFSDLTCSSASLWTLSCFEKNHPLKVHGNLNDINNYRPLEKPIVDTTTKKVQQVIMSLLQEGHIDDMMAKWLSLTPNPLRIPVFYTLTKIHIPTSGSRPITSECDGPTEHISAFVDHRQHRNCDGDENGCSFW